VNRCWKCGQTFALRPEIDGRPPVRPDVAAAADEPLEAILIEEGSANQLSAPSPVAAAATAEVGPISAVAVAVGSPLAPRAAKLRAVSPVDLIDAQRASLTAMGGTAAAFVLGVFALGVGLFGFWGVPVAVLGLVMGIWGLYSARRRWALAAMLLCCLAIGLSSYTGARLLYVQILKSRPAVQEDESFQLPP